jgi:hypothetical protein
MKRRSSDDEVERRSRCLPLIKIRDHSAHVCELRDAFLEQTCEISTALHGYEVEPSLRQRYGELTRTGANLQTSTAAPQFGQGEQIVDQRLWISGTSSRVKVGNLVERLCPANGALAAAATWHSRTHIQLL